MKEHFESWDMVKSAKQRSSIYGLFALIYRSEINKPLLQHLKNPDFQAVLSGMGAELGDDFLTIPEDDLLENLAVEYTRLFLGPGKHISPHESLHHARDDGDWGQFWGADTVAVKKFIEGSGLEYTAEYTGLPDHISTELEFMQKVVAREAQAREENNEEDVQCCLAIEKSFLEDHLLKWVPGFCDKIIAEAELSFYGEFARISRQYLEFDREELNGYAEIAY